MDAPGNRRGQLIHGQRDRARPPCAAIFLRSAGLRIVARAGPPFLPPFDPRTFAARVSLPSELFSVVGMGIYLLERSRLKICCLSAQALRRAPSLHRKRGRGGQQRLASCPSPRASHILRCSSRGVDQAYRFATSRFHFRSRVSAWRRSCSQALEQHGSRFFSRLMTCACHHSAKNVLRHIGHLHGSVLSATAYLTVRGFTRSGQTYKAHDVL